MKPVALLLAALLLLPQESSRADQPAQPQPAAAAICAAVVIVAGGIVIYKLAKFCQRKFSKPPPPPDTNDPPALVFSLEGVQPSYGGANTPATCPSCQVSFAPMLDAVPVATTETPFQLVAYVDDSSGAPVANMAGYFVESQDQQEDFGSFEAQLLGWGLTLSLYGPGTSYSINGIPCDPSVSPISFDAAGNVTVDLGGTLYNVLVERSSDLVTWQPILQTFVSANMPLVITDVSTDSQAFYRVTAQ